MKKLLLAIIAFAILGGASMSVMASPAKDLKEFRAYFFKRFPGVPLQEYANGIYAIDKNRRLEWEAMEEFPPYEPAVDIGKELFDKYNSSSYRSLVCECSIVYTTTHRGVEPGRLVTNATTDCVF